jgi:rhodanese-related sulfurtransferase
LPYCARDDCQSRFTDARRPGSISRRATRFVPPLISPKELAEALKQDKSMRVVDVRSREEFDAVHIDGSTLLSQDVMRQIMADGSNTKPLVVVDHQGKNGLDAAAYFMGHGLQNVRCLRGGIDAWAQEVDTGMRRYKVG